MEWSFLSLVLRLHPVRMGDRERDTIDHKHKIQSMCIVFETTTASISKCIKTKMKKNGEKITINTYIWSKCGRARKKKKESRELEREAGMQNDEK